MSVRFQLNKKGGWLVLIGLVLLSIATGVGIWKLTSADTQVAPDDSSASEDLPGGPPAGGYILRCNPSDTGSNTSSFTLSWTCWGLHLPEARPDREDYPGYPAPSPWKVLGWHCPEPNTSDPNNPRTCNATDPGAVEITNQNFTQLNGDPDGEGMIRGAIVSNFSSSPAWDGCGLVQADVFVPHPDGTFTFDNRRYQVVGAYLYDFGVDCTDAEPYCGDGNVDPGEACDDGNTNNDDGCRNDCTVPAPYCGDGVVGPGEACDPNAVNTCEYGSCNLNCTCPQQPPPNCGNGVVDPGEACDPLATNTCDYGPCQVDCLCPEPNPGWNMTKVGTPSCSATADPYADVAYTVVVTNNGTTPGTLRTVVDQLSPIVQSDWILQDTISPAGVVNGNTITWTVNQPMAVGESLTFRYSIRVPRTAFGEIGNLVTATPEEGQPFTVEETVRVSCNTPVTGLFDSTASKVTAGVVLVSLSLGYLAFDKFDVISVNAIGSVSSGARKRFGKEARVRKARKRFENEW